MRIPKRDEGVYEGDLTPMIDMTFQLIAFFMVLINFSQTESHEKIQLPSSELAKPADEAPESVIILHLGDDGTVYMGGDAMTIGTLRPYLVREIEVLKRKNPPQQPADATVVIRAHKYAPAGQVQELIKVCQENGFETFALRAKERINI